MSALSKLQRIFFKDGSLNIPERDTLMGMAQEVYAAAPATVIATTGGGTTGLIDAEASFVGITSDNANKQISLPAAIAGKKLTLFCAATGCELISAVAADKVNNLVVGATNEAALVAGTLYRLTYDGVDNWVMLGNIATGAVEAPVVPNIL